MEFPPALPAVLSRQGMQSLPSRRLHSGDARRSSRLGRPAGTWWLALALLAASTAAVAETERASEVDPLLLQSLRQIETAFRAGDAGRLASVLPPDSKVLVGLESFSQPKAYYAPDQVILIFRKIFRNARVIRFSLKRDDLALSHSDLVYVPATWSLREDTSGMKDCRLQFTIRKEGDRYYVRGIKEVH